MVKLLLQKMLRGWWLEMHFWKPEDIRRDRKSG